MQSTASQPRLSLLQLEVLKALVSGVTVSQAAAAAEIHRSTIYHWCRYHPEFRSSLAELRGRQAEALRDEMQAIALDAVFTLKAIFADEAASPHVRLKAALAVIKSIESAEPAESERMPEAEYNSLWAAEPLEAAAQPVPIRQNPTEFDTISNSAAA